MASYFVGDRSGSSSSAGASEYLDDDIYDDRRRSIERIASLQSPMGLPDWMTTDTDSLMGELKDMYGRIPGLTSPKGIRRAFDGAIATTQGMGGQIANNATREAIARAGTTGGQINSAMVKAQAMLPVYDTTSKLKVDKAAAIQDARKTQASMMTAVAGQLASLRTNYLTALGNIHNQKQSVTNSWVANEEDSRRRQQAQDRQYQLSLEELASRGRGGAGGGGAIPNFSGQMTRQPNGAAGGRGVEYTPEFEEYLAAMGGEGADLSREGAAGFPAGGGVGFGDSMDGYNAQLRRLTSLASGGKVAPYNASIRPIEGLDPRNGFYNDPDVTYRAGEPSIADLIAMLQSGKGGGGRGLAGALAGGIA